MRIAGIFGLALVLGACGGGGGTGGGAVSLGFTSAALVSVAEGVIGAFHAVTARSPSGGALTFSITGGEDAAKFALAPAGALSFVASPDFELAGDANSDGVYLVQLTVSDGSSSVSQTLTVTVTNRPGPLVARRVATGLNQPLFLTGYSGTRVLVLEKEGRVRLLDVATGIVEPTPFLDLVSEINSELERGLLGLALAPDFAVSRTFFVNLTNLFGNIEIRKYHTLPGNPDRADQASPPDMILGYAQPMPTHKGGWMGFGPDGLLYIASGDGGGGNDPFRNGQNPNVLLGKVLRINPASDAFPTDADRDYAIPAGNPYAGGGGAPEVWLTGLRNPWRASFDRSVRTNLYIGDVGQNVWEEINLATTADGGRNYGWSTLEGPMILNPGPTAGLTAAVAQYPHGPAGNSVTGGYVYRGPVSSLVGQYLFGDFVTGQLWSVPVTSLTQGATLAETAFIDRRPDLIPSIGAINNISSFGEDLRGNVYIVDFDGDIFLITEAD